MLVVPSVVAASSPSLIGLQAGKSKTSWRNEKKMLIRFFCSMKKRQNEFTLMLLLSVNIIVKRSIPMPQPPVGGRPYSRAVQKFSSINWASSSPASLSYKKKQ